MRVTSNSYFEFLEELTRTIESTALQLLSFSEDETTKTPAAEKWTRKQILGHLIDSAANNHQRFVRAQFSDDLVFSGYEQDRWVKVQQYNDEEWSRLVELWKLYNLHLVHVVSHISPTQLAQQRAEHNLDQIAWQKVDRDQPATLEYFIRDYAAHMKHHLNQILSTDLRDRSERLT